MSKAIDGYMVKGTVKLDSVDYSADISPNIIKLPARSKIVHKRNVSVKNRRDVNLAFYMNKTYQDINCVFHAIDVMGHQPAVFAECESLRVSQHSMSGLFSAAYEHAKRRKLNCSSIYQVGIPILGTTVLSKEENLILMLILQNDGSRWFELYPSNDKIHPAWMIPVVEKQ